jgi:hypothetical protein
MTVSWETEEPHARIEHQPVPPNVDLFYVVSLEKVHGPFFFTEAAVTGDSFLEMLENWFLPQLNTNYDDYILQLDGALPQFLTNVLVLLNRVFQQSWIGHAANGDNTLLHWPHRSPDLTACDFFLWGFAKDSVYVPPMPMPIYELHDRITHALQPITADMLH